MATRNPLDAFYTAFNGMPVRTLIYDFPAFPGIQRPQNKPAPVAQTQTPASVSAPAAPPRASEVLAPQPVMQDIPVAQRPVMDDVGGSLIPGRIGRLARRMLF